MFLLLLPFIYVLDGFVVSTLFNWFVASLAGFNITVLQGIGISLLAACLTYQTPVTAHLSEREKEQHHFEVILNGFFTSIILLIVGAITHALM